VSETPATLDDLLHIPRDLTYDAFIEKVDQDEAALRQSLRTYVLGDKVYEQLDKLCSDLGHRLSAGNDTGRYLYGSFGSGKSHLLNVLGAMLERRPETYDLGHERLRKLRSDHPWLAEAPETPPSAMCWSCA
jgi:predicted ATPase